MGTDNIDDIAKQFLTVLLDMTKGDPASQISMYQVGEAVGLDKEESAKTAELLIGNGLAEIKTLSGGMGITEAAALELKESAGKAEGADGVSALPRTPIIDAAARSSIDIALTSIKHHINELGLAFDDIAGIIADIKTIEAQLASPASKTAIVRECFVSLKSWTEKTGHDPIKEQIKSILG